MLLVEGCKKMTYSKQSLKHQFDNLYTMPIPSTRTGLFYNTFSYPTKISPETIAIYIAMHTKPGDTVLDVFGGSGSTGIAALMCEHPTKSMIELARERSLQVTWGARNAIIYELGRYGAFASSVMATPPDKNEFSLAVKHLLEETESELTNIYSVTDSNGKPGVIRHIIYSDILLCNQCKSEFTYYHGMVRQNPLSIDGDGICTQCGFSDKSTNFQFVTQVVNDNILGTQVCRRKRIPVRIYGQTGIEKWVRDANEADLIQFEHRESQNYPSHCKQKKLYWGELYRSGYHYGVTHLHHFYTKRNYQVMHNLWNRTKSYPDKIRNAIQLLLLSYNASHATLMTRVVVKKNTKDFVLTGAQSGVLYISSMPVEKNIITGIKRKLRYFEDAFSYLNKCTGHIEINNSSSHCISQKNDSIDYVFTDPPFGDFIPYAEVNQINELWIGEPTNREDEIIISRSQNKTERQYQEMLTRVFCEVNRVLKDGANATVVFHSSKASVWNALCYAYTNAGLGVTATASLQKSQTSFKQTVSEGSVQGDPMILLSKGSTAKSSSSSELVLDEVIDNEVAYNNLNQREMYSSYIGKCLRRGITIEYDAKTAYDYMAIRTGANT